MAIKRKDGWVIVQAALRTEEYEQVFEPQQRDADLTESSYIRRQCGFEVLRRGLKPGAKRQRKASLSGRKIKPTATAEKARAEEVAKASAVRRQEVSKRAKPDVNRMSATPFDGHTEPDADEYYELIDESCVPPRGTEQGSETERENGRDSLLDL